MDNCSMMSQSSLVSSFTVIHTLAKKKSEQETRAKHNNYIIIGLNICVIGLSVFCLTYEDQLNNKLESLLRIYKTSASLNRFAAGLIVHFLSVICSPSENGKCESMMQKYFSQFEEYIEFFNRRIKTKYR